MKHFKKVKSVFLNVIISKLIKHSNKHQLSKAYLIGVPSRTRTDQEPSLYLSNVKDKQTLVTFNILERAVAKMATGWFKNGENGHIYIS